MQIRKPGCQDTVYGDKIQVQKTHVYMNCCNTISMKASSFFMVFQDRISLFCPCCPGKHFVDQAGLTLRDLPASAS